MLTDIKIKCLKPKEKAYKVSDGQGLYLFISSIGNKIWRYNYLFKGKAKTITFGQYPIVSLKEARELLFETKRTLKAGVDPIARQQATKEIEANNSFKDVALEYMEIR
jgi:hypothetical protein